MHFIMGITGKTGGALAKQLLTQGRPVKALVRDRSKAQHWQDQGVELIEGEWDDAEAIIRGLSGAESAFLMLPPVYTPAPDFQESVARIEAFTQALHAAPPGRLVVLSSNGAEQTSRLGAITPLFLLERALKNLTYPHAFIRPGGFYENQLYGLQAAQGGVFPTFYADLEKKYPMTATVDIAAEAARLLTGPSWTGRRVIELGSMVSPTEVAIALGEVLGHPVRAQSVPREVWTATLEKMGFASGTTWAFEEIYDGVNSGWIGFGVPGAERVEGSTTAREVFAASTAAAG